MKKLLSLLIVAVVVCYAGMVLADDTVTVPGPGAVATPIPDAVIFPIVKGSVTLTEGWNLIAIPVLPAEQLKIKDFVAKITPPQPPLVDLNGDGVIDQNDVAISIRPMWKVTTIAVYKDGRFRTYAPDNATYNMVPGEAYFVYCQYLGPRPVYDVNGPQYPMPEFHPTITVTIAGKAVNASVSLDLNKGWNGVGVALIQQRPPLVYDQKPILLPEIPNLTLNQTESTQIDEYKIVTMDFSLLQLSRELCEQGVKATRAIFWNANKQEWEQYALPYPTVDANGLVCMPVPGKLINPSEGFFLLCEENGLYIPRLTIQKPPYPPIPVPRRVSYTGTIEKIMFYPEAKPPYDFVLQYELVSTDPVTGATSAAVIQVPVKGATEEIEKQLGELANLDVNGNKTKHFVEGVMQTIEWSAMYPPDRRYVDVLIVDSIDLFRL